MSFPTVTHHICTRTEVVYPNGGPTYNKWDYFLIESDKLPDGYYDKKEISPEDWYDFLNEGGYWYRGHQEIKPEHEEWIKAHQAEGSQDEITKNVEFIA